MAKVTIEVEVTDEDMEAAKYAMFRGWPDPPPFTANDVKDTYLTNAVTAKLHELRSRAKWDKLKLYEKVPKEDGLTSTKVFDKAGKSHDVMLPGGYLRRPQILSPREGRWPCEHKDVEVCWYDNQSDPVWDFCVFCGAPDERK